MKGAGSSQFDSASLLCGRSSVGRALDCGSSRRGFESRRSPRDAVDFPWTASLPWCREWGKSAHVDERTVTEGVVPSPAYGAGAKALLDSPLAPHVGASGGSHKKTQVRVLNGPPVASNRQSLTRSVQSRQDQKNKSTTNNKALSLGRTDSWGLQEDGPPPDSKSGAIGTNPASHTRLPRGGSLRFPQAQLGSNPRAPTTNPGWYKKRARRAPVAHSPVKEANPPASRTRLPRGGSLRFPQEQEVRFLPGAPRQPPREAHKQE